MKHRKASGWLFWTALALSLSCACTSEETKGPGGIMIVTSTDLQIPKDVTHLGIQVLTSNGVPRLEKWYALNANPDQAKLPATLAIEPGQTDDPVRIRIFARRVKYVIALSEVTTTVPRDRVAMLRMPIEWLSAGMVKPTDGTSTLVGSGGSSAMTNAPDAASSDNVAFPGEPGFDSVQTTCSVDESPRAGTCNPSAIDSATLPTFSLGQVFGHGTGNGDGTCYDTVGCFANSTPVVIADRSACVGHLSQISSTPDKLTLGMIPADGSGICGPGGCVVTLDYVAPGDLASGWSLQNDEIQLPIAVCRKLNDGTLRAVIASTACATKTPEVPNCGAWSSVDSVQASAPTNSDLLSLCWDFAKQACEGIGRCRGGAGFMQGVIEDDGTCTERMRFLCDASLTRPEAEPWRTYFENCGAAFTASDCTQVETKIRSACVEPSATTGAKTEGSACSFGQCGQNAICLGAVPGGIGKCTARFDVGITHCGTNSVLDALFPQGACKSDLICDQTSQTCETPGTTGALCAADDSCQPNLVCVNSGCSTPKVAGDTCGDDTECASGLHCINASNRQRCRGPGQVGESCTVVAQNQQVVLWQENLCDITKSLRCDSTTNKCSLARLVEQGAACTTLNSCAGGYCSGIVSKDPVTSGTCQGYVADGAACKQTAQCGPPAECLELSCRLRPAFGISAVTMQNVPGEQPCPTGQSSCDTGCVNLQIDVNNCGQCNTVCASGRQCRNGQCDCGSQEIRCGVCVAAQSDAQNCGRCGHQCANNETCVSGLCTACISGNCQPTGATGGSTGAGGSVSVGGKISFGGTISAGGAGGSTSIGGTRATGGVGNSTVGGTVSTGGTKSAGGTTLVSIGGTKASGGVSSISVGGAVAATGSVGATGGAGGTSGSSALAQCPASTSSSGGTGGTSSVPFSVTAQGYVTSGDWQGYMSTSVDTLGSTINGPYASLTGIGLCVTGAAVPGNLAPDNGWAALWFYVQQASTGEILSISPTSAGINIQVENHTGSPLRVQVGGPNMAVDDNQKWCAVINGNGGYIPWSAFNTHCWDGTGNPYHGESLQSISIVAISSSILSSTAFDYCLVNIGEVGSVSQELVNAAGWVGGDANSTSDDPFGIQGGFWANGDGVAYTAPTGNPCTATGCCIQGQTIVDSSFAAWGAQIGLDLGYFPNAQAANTASACPYRGNADCFDMVFTGTTGANRVYFNARAIPSTLPTGETDPLVEIPAFSNGWSGRICFANLACSSWSPDCTVTGNWYSLNATVVGGERNASFNLCLTSFKAVKNL